MFRALPAGTLIDAPATRLVALYRSTNTPSVAIGGGPSVPARAYVLGFSSTEGKYRAFVYFGATVTTSDARRSGLLFACQPDELRFHELDRSIQAAMEMVEQQGFDMQKHEYSSLDASMRQKLHEHLPFSDAPAPSSGRPAVTPNLPPLSTSPAPPVSRVPSDVFPVAVSDSLVGFRTGQFENAVDISREVSLPSMQAVDTLVRMLSLF